VQEAAAAGVSEWRVRGNDLLVPFSGVRSLEEPDDVRSLCAAYVPKMGAQEFFSHSTAAALHGMWLPLEVQRGGRVHVAVRRPARAPRDRRVTGHHLIDRPGLVWGDGDWRLSSPIEAWCQLATQVSMTDLIVAGDSLLAKGTADPARTLQRMHSALAGRPRPMSNVLARAILDVRIGVRSAGESDTRILIVHSGLPEPLINHRIQLLDGSWIEGDMVYPDKRVLVEYEGDWHRTDVTKWRSDITRYEAVKDTGWRAIRLTSDDLRFRRREFVERLRRALA
jgi:hypothetical protein